MVTHLIFIRHAESTWNALRRWQGHADMPLSEAGREQARLLARRLSTWRIDHIVASDLLRAAETADILGEALGIRPVVDPVWRERSFGEAEGLTAEEIAARFPAIWAARVDGPMMGVPGSEAYEDVVARARDGCETLLARYGGRTVAVVSHGGMILTTLVYLLGLPTAAHSLLTVGGNTSICRVAVTDGQARLVGLNDAAHLEGFVIPNS